MTTRMLITVALAVLIAGASFAQDEPADGINAKQNPPGLNWRQIQTERFRVIFPEVITTEAQRVANTLEHTYGSVSKTLRGPEKPLELVLVNQSTNSNGFVGLSPRRSEWLSTPFQQAGLVPGEWYEALALHEMRHTVQLDRMNRGLVRLYRELFGDTGRALGSYLLFPQWFREGDAVGIETALTETGRGRIPQFDLDIRAMLLAGWRYSYYKAYHRSYHDWYPDHYKLGYFMTTYVRRRYGPETWDKVIGSAANWAFHPFTFNFALRKHTGASAPETYERAMDELTELWQAQQKDLPVTPAEVLDGQNQSGVWTNYKYPHPLPDGSVLATKSGMADLSALVRLYPDGREERVCYYASLVGSIRSAGGKVVWNRKTPDLRWGKRDYSDVVVLDIDSGQKHQLTHKAKLFAPVPSPDGTRIAAIEFGSDRRCHLVLLGTTSGAEQARFSAPTGVLWRTPSWSEDGRYIAVSRQNTHGTALERIDAASGEGQIVLPYTRADIGWPIFYGSYLLFDAPYGGFDNIHAVHLSSGARYQVTSRPLAAIHAAVASDSLLFEDYTVDGYRIANMPLDPATWTPIEQVEDRSMRYYKPMIDEEQGGSVLEDIPQKIYPVKHYRPLAHLFKIHSWSPLPKGSTYSLSLKSGDLLNLSKLSSGVEYNSNEKAFSVLGDFQLAAWYPILNVGGRWGKRAGTYTLEEEDRNDKDKEIVTDRWTEKSVHGGIEVPLNFSRGIWNSSANLRAKAAWTHITGKNDPNHPDLSGVFEENQDGYYVPLTYQLTLNRSRSKATRDLASAWKQRLQLTYRHTPFAGDYDGTLLSGQLSLRFPGLWKHHSLLLKAAYEWQDPGAVDPDANPYRFASEHVFVRGYDYHFHRRFTQGAVNYALPLSYPDWNLGSLIYFKRFKMNLFYDYGRGEDGTSVTTYQSAGAELTSDLFLFSISLLPVDMGVRYAYRFGEKDSRFEFMFASDLP